MAKNKYLGMAKETVGVGVGTMVGHGVLGSMGSIPGMPAAGKTAGNIAGSSLNLINVGQMAKVGMNIMPKIKSDKKHTKDCNVVKNILRR